MKIDTHVHLLISKQAEPDWLEIEFTLVAAARDGLDVLCICEHLDATHYEELLSGIFEENRFGGQLIAPGILRLDSGLVLSSGAEVSLRGGGDVGVHAPPALLLELNRIKGYYSLADLLDALQTYGQETAVVAHHVFYKEKWIGDLRSLGKRLTAVELPAKDLASHAKYQALAVELDLPLVGGGDGHTWLQIGACYTNTTDNTSSDATQFSLPHFKNILGNKEVTPVPVAGAERLVKMSRLYRERLERTA